MRRSWRITLRHADLPTARFNARSDETVADAARRAGIALPLACERGGCGACRASLDTGEVQYLGAVSQRRREGDGGKLYELLCRAAPRSDLTLQCVHPWRAVTVAGALSGRLGGN